MLLPLLLRAPAPAHLLVEGALPATERLHLGLERDGGGAELRARLLEERLRDPVLALELGALLEQVRLHTEAGGRGRGYGVGVGARGRAKGVENRG